MQSGKFRPKFKISQMLFLKARFFTSSRRFIRENLACLNAGRGSIISQEVWHYWKDPICTVYSEEVTRLWACKIWKGIAGILNYIQELAKLQILLSYKQMMVKTIYNTVWIMTPDVHNIYGSESMVKTSHCLIQVYISWGLRLHMPVKISEPTHI